MKKDPIINPVHPVNPVQKHNRQDQHDALPKGHHA